MLVSKNGEIVGIYFKNDKKGSLSNCLGSYIRAFNNECSNHDVSGVEISDKYPAQHWRQSHIVSCSCISDGDGAITWYSGKKRQMIEKLESDSGEELELGTYISISSSRDNVLTAIRNSIEKSILLLPIGLYRGEMGLLVVLLKSCEEGREVEFSNEVKSILMSMENW